VRAEGVRRLARHSCDPAEAGDRTALACVVAERPAWAPN